MESVKIVKLLELESFACINACLIASISQDSEEKVLDSLHADVESSVTKAQPADSRDLDPSVKIKLEFVPLIKSWNAFINISRLVSFFLKLSQIVSKGN